MIGQITRNQMFGDLLYQYAKSPKVETIVEIGTWNGMGSTKCIIDGLLERENNNYTFITIELYPEQYQQAMINLKNVITPNIKLLNGRIIDYDEAFWFDHSVLNMSDPHASLWYKRDMEYLKTEANVINQLPPKIDLLVLDGGEYTTYPEYRKLKDRCSIIALDDTSILKCSKIRQELLEGGYRVVCDNPTERNGWAIFQLK